MLLIFSFEWEIRQGLAYGHWKNRQITENLGLHGNISLIRHRIVKFTSAKIRLNRFAVTTM